MAAFSQTHGRSSCLFAESTSQSIDLQKEKSDSAEGSSPRTIHKLSSFVDRPANMPHLFGDREFPTDTRINYVHAEKRLLLDASTNRSGGEIRMSSMSTPIDGVLDITIHHARDIHNICIYGNQDVYAKFSITHTQDAVYSTQPVRAGGKNPVFNQSLQILISQPDAVLKCEIWMMSCVRTYLEDQLLGFVLVPLADLLGKGKHTRDYALSSTDLFHTPAGTLCLSLAFYSRLDAPVTATESFPEIMHMEGGNESRAVVDYNKIEFPDLQLASENQQLVSEYLKMASSDLKMDSESTGQESHRNDETGTSSHQQQEFSGAPFLQLVSSPVADVDWEMTLHTGEEKSENASPVSGYGLPSPSSDTTLSIEDAPSSSPSVNTVPTSSTTTEERNSVSSPNNNSIRSLDLPSSSANFFGSSSQTTHSPGSVSCGAVHSSSDEKENGKSDGQDKGGSFTNPLVSIPMEPEETVVQQQIVDMYMKSMQQFTESLAKMKLPLDIDGERASVEPKSNSQAGKKGTTEPRNKDGHRVFYGSRAFF